MANKKHFAKLKEGVKIWNQWRENNRNIKPDLNGANLEGVNLNGANLEGANLERANLRSANFELANLRSANLIGTNLELANLERANLRSSYLWSAKLKGVQLSGASLCFAKLKDVDLSNVNLCSAKLKDTDLHSANLERANLKDTDLSEANLIGANLEGAELRYAKLKNTTIDFTTKLEPKWRRVWEIINTRVEGKNLTEADLSGAYLDGSNLAGFNLTDANLSGSNLTGVILNSANLSGANLTGVVLKEVQALKTNFSETNLTGACIEDWNINSLTNLANVKCDYIYLKANNNDRRPYDPNKFFAPGEFAKLFQKAFETIDLFFQNGADWQAIAYSLNNVRILNNNTPLTVQKIENMGDGDVLISVNVPQFVDKGKIEGDFWQDYEFAQKQLEEQFQAKIKGNDKEINRLFYMVNEQRKLIGNTYSIDGNVSMVYSDRSKILDNPKIAGELNENSSSQS